MRTLISIFLVIAAALTLHTSTAFASATLTTGKADYHPGEVVDITGSGFVPGETYAMPVMRPNGSIVTVDPILHLATPGWEFATADASGNLVYNYQLNGVEGSYEARAYPVSWAGDWSETPVASVTFTDSPTKITASQHQGQQKTLGILGGYTSGNVTQYTEGEDINFRFTLDATHGPASGQIEVRFSRDDGDCVFFDPAFSLGTVEALSGPQPTVTVDSGPTASGDGTEWIVVLDIDYATTFDHVANSARVNYTLTLSDEAGNCTGSSQHSRLNPAGGDVAQTGAQNVPVPANQVIELPDITVTKMIDRDGNGSFESTAAAGEYKFTLDGTTELLTDANGQAVFENVTPDGAHTVTEQQVDFSQGTYSFDSGQNVSNCVFTGSTANPIVAAGTTPTNASCTFRNEVSSASITVDKDFSDDSSGEVTVSLDCGTATETTVDGTATESDDAEFTVVGFDGDDVCTATEGSAPSGYTKNESDCQSFDPESKTSCQIVNTLNSAVVNVAKDFSPDNANGSVTVSLDCGQGVNVVNDDTSATDADTADFTVEGFTSSTVCSASEGQAPAGYTKDESGCQSIDPEQVGVGAECTIVNTLNSATITVDKDFSDDSSSGEVTVDLTCESGTVTDTDATATESDDAEFLVEGFTVGDTCDATEGSAPSGYTKDESDCQDLVLGTDTSCQIVNTRKGGGGSDPDDPPEDDPIVRVPDAPVPPVLDTTEGNCLRRPVIAFVRGKPIKRVVFILDGERIKVLKRPDAQRRWTVRVERRGLSEGTHKLVAKVFVGWRARPYRLSTNIKPCLDKTAPEEISIAGPAGRGSCPTDDFLAYVRGETISSVTYSLNGESLGTVEVEDWKRRFGVKIDPSELGRGKNTLEATVRFIARSKTDPRTLRAELPSCAGR